jgi:hypothetical protein
MNAQMTITYWEIGRRTIYSDQAGAKTVDYGDVHIKRLAKDLSASIAAYWPVRTGQHAPRHHSPRVGPSDPTTGPCLYVSSK